jgi:APA family basic amino acid/polyamine antiporter
MSEAGNGLSKVLRPVDAIMIVIGNVVGVGIFTTTGFIAAEIADAWLILSVWLLGGVLTLMGSLTYGELGAAFPRAGGDYVYLSEAYGPLAGFLVGWVGFLIINPGSVASLSLGLAEYLLPLAAGKQTMEMPILTKAVALAAIVVFSGINILSLRLASRVQNLVSLLSLITIVGVVVAGFALGQGNWSNFNFTDPEAGFGDVFGPAMVSVFFTYSGWFVAAYVASEIKNPQKWLPRTLIIGSLVVCVLYMLVNALYIYALPVLRMQGVVDIMRLAYENMFGFTASALVSVMILIAILGSLNSVILTSPRIYFAMARDGLFPNLVGKAHPKLHTPVWAIVIQACLSCVMVLVGNFYQLLSYTVFFMLLTSIATAIGVIVMRKKRPTLERPYRVPGYPLIPLLFIAAYVWIGLRIFLHNPTDSLIGLGITASGVPFYLWWRKAGHALWSPGPSGQGQER